MVNFRKNIFPVIILLSVYTIPLFFDNNLINVNVIHFFLFSVLTFFLCLILFFYKFTYLYNPRIKIITGTFALFILFISISSSVNNRFLLASEHIAIYIIVFVFSYLLFLCFQLFDREKLLYYISFAVTIVCVIVSLLGLMEFFNIYLLNFRINSRPGSTLSIRNFASEYSIIALPFIFIFIFKNTGKILKILSYASLFLILTFIFFCRTRTSFVIIIFYLIAVSVYFFYNKFFSEEYLKSAYLYFIIILGISFLAGNFSAPNIDKERSNLVNTISSIADKNYPENEARINYWKTSLRIFRDVPITGIGTGSWFGIYPAYNGNIYNDENILKTPELNPHNDYLEILSENGIFGFVFFMLFLFLAGKYLFYEMRRDMLILPALLSFSGFLILSLFSFPRDSIAIMILTGTTIGISLSEKEKWNEEKLISLNVKTVKTIFLSLAAVILLALTVFCHYRYRYEAAYLNAMKDKIRGNYEAMLDKINEINYDVYPVDANCMPVEYYRGIGYFELKNYPEAMKSFDKALELTPTVPSILNNKASSFYMLNDTENAVKLLTELKRRNPFLIESQINLLAIYSNKGQDSLARILIGDIEKKSFDRKYIKNYIILENIKVYYNEKNSP